jgi:hypothetical protein
MIRFASLGLVATLALTACSSAFNAGAVPTGAGGPAAEQRVRHLAGEAKEPLDTMGGAPKFRLALELFDAPLIGAPPGVKFNAGILGVDAIDTAGNSWQLIGEDKPQVVNLLDLQNEALDLGAGKLPVGTYVGVELLLDPATTNVTLDKWTFPVRFVTSNHPWWDPTQTIESVRVPLRITGNKNDAISATLDFNVFQSANFKNGVIYLVPTVAAALGESAINGKVANRAGKAVPNATVVATDAQGHVANTALTAADGSYHLRGIAAGGYTVSVLNTFTTNAGVTIRASGSDPGAAPSAYVVVGPNEVNLSTLID